MLTTDYLNQLIEANTKKANETAKPKEISKICKLIAFYRTCKLYLETGPRGDYLHETIARNEGVIASIRHNNKHLFARNVPRKMMTKAKKDLGIMKLEQENKVLRLLINNP